MHLKNKTTCLLAIFVLQIIFQGCAVMPSIHANFPKTNQNEAPFRGVFHVHTRYSHDSLGSIQSVIKTASKENFDFVVVTDHNSLKGKFDKALLGRPKPLIIFGNEISTSDGHLVALGIDKEIPTPVEPQSAIDQIHQEGGYAVLAHPVCKRTSWKDWNVTNYDAIEVYNFACDFYDSNKVMLAAKSLLLPPDWFIRKIAKTPEESLRKWDELLFSKQVAGIGAADSHVCCRVFGFPLIRYSLSFRSVTTYVYAKSLSEKDILEALIHGKSFIAFESRGFAKKFRFTAKTAQGQFKPGSVVISEAPVTLAVELPIAAQIRLIHNGEQVAVKKGKTLVFPAKDSGIYRVEVFRNGKIWILSNPISIQM